MNSHLKPQPWMRRVLIAAGIYNIIWGLLAVLSPQWTLSWLGLKSGPPVAQLWQCIGMIVGVYGIGYLIAAQDAYRHWPITLVGLLGKILGSVGFLYSMIAGTLPGSVGWTILSNDLIWWFPFAGILWGAVRHNQGRNTAHDTFEADDPVRDLVSHSGESLDDLAKQQPQLVLFLRHAGCTFCREALADLSSQRSAVEAAGCGIVLVHMGDDLRDSHFFARYGLGDVPRIADPECRLYRQFGLDLGTFSELFGVRVWLRGLIAGLLDGHGVGRSRGNSFQMPGVYIYDCGRISGGFRHERASDRPVYSELARKCVPSRQSAAVV